MGKLRFISSKDFALSTALGVEFATIMCLGTFGGFWVDKKLNTFPWFLLAGAIAGFILALFILIKHAKVVIHTANTENKK